MRKVFETDDLSLDFEYYALPGWARFFYLMPLPGWLVCQDLRGAVTGVGEGRGKEMTIVVRMTRMVITEVGDGELGCG